MINFESITKKNFKCKKHQRVIKVLKKSIEVTIIIKLILDLGVNSIIGK